MGGVINFDWNSLFLWEEQNNAALLSTTSFFQRKLSDKIADRKGE